MPFDYFMPQTHSGARQFDHFSAGDDVYGIVGYESALPMFVQMDLRHQADCADGELGGLTFQPGPAARGRRAFAPG